MALTPVELQASFDRQQIDDALLAATAGYERRVPVDLIGKQLGRDLNGENFTEGVEETTQRVAALQTQLGEFAKSSAQVNSLRRDLDGMLGEDVPERFKAVATEIQRLSEKPLITNDEVANAKELLAAAAEGASVFNSGFGDYFFNNPEAETQLGAALALLERLQDARRQMFSSPVTQGGGFEKVTAEVQALEQALKLTEFEARLNDAASSAQSAATATGALAAKAIDGANAYERMAAAAERINTSAEPAGRQFGGRMFLADGGRARGVDRIPAMLSPGEFVVNSRSAQRWHSQLLALNAGQVPSFQSGGTVNNNSIGDIHVNVTESKGAHKTARQVVAEIRHAIRRGTVRL